MCSRFNANLVTKLIATTRVLVINLSMSEHERNSIYFLVYLK